MSRDKRKQARRRQLFEQLRLQSEILCESHNEAKQNVVLNRMMAILLGLTSQRKLNQQMRKILADHLTDCAYERAPHVELGGPYERNLLHIDGVFDIGDLAKRIVWTETRQGIQV